MSVKYFSHGQSRRLNHRLWFMKRQEAETKRKTTEHKLCLSRKRKVSCICLCKQHDCSCHCMSVNTDAFRRAQQRQEQENRQRLSLWVRVLLYISHWPLKVALCHNTLVHTTPAAVNCHTLLLSACQPARFSRRASIPHGQIKAVSH